ncbi:hypothetical protein AOC36_02715 [Erysipelothrix larvae]|uniref:Uncharacterized protein n=2 Tax=Erysipelothrix larvae TaxID=1514105 RepID=A0A0X8GYT3_9FIRM|nr:hypothetical protein AOC36_02715 [Erysipelothrix larvae]
MLDQHWSMKQRPMMPLYTPVLNRSRKEGIYVSFEAFESKMIEASTNGLPPIRTVWNALSSSKRPLWNTQHETLIQDALYVLQTLSKKYHLGIIVKSRVGS